MRPRLLVTPTILIALTFSAAGCDGGGDPCQQACEKQKACARPKLDALNCDDPQLKTACDAIRQALAVDCSQAAGAACTGDFRAMSERTLSCDMDPNTCTCPRNVCLDVCLDQKDCAESNLDGLDCSDAANKDVCDAQQPMAHKDCYAITDAQCTGTLKAAAEALDSCFMDHDTCTCP